MRNPTILVVALFVVGISGAIGGIAPVILRGWSPCVDLCNDGCMSTVTPSPSSYIEFTEVPTVTTGDCDPKNYPDTGSDCLIEASCKISGKLKARNLSSATIRLTYRVNGGIAGQPEIPPGSVVELVSYPPNTPITCDKMEGSFTFGELDYASGGQWWPGDGGWSVKCSKCNVTAGVGD